MKKPVETAAELESRRKFLKTMAAAGGAVAAIGAGGAVAAAPELVEQPEQPKEKRGYRQTAHVSEYYAKASF